MLGTMATTAKGRAAAEGTEAETMTFDEAMERYDGEWLVLRVVSEDEQRYPVEVQVLARYASEKDARHALGELRGEGGVTDTKLRLLEAGPRIRSGAAVRRALAELSARDEPELDDLAGRGVWIGAER